MAGGTADASLTANLHPFDPEHLIVNGLGGAFLHPTHVFAPARFASVPDPHADELFEQGLSPRGRSPKGGSPKGGSPPRGTSPSRGMSRRGSFIGEQPAATGILVAESPECLWQGAAWCIWRLSVPMVLCTLHRQPSWAQIDSAVTKHHTL